MQLLCSCQHQRQLPILIVASLLFNPGRHAINSFSRQPCAVFIHYVHPSARAFVPAQSSTSCHPCILLCPNMSSISDPPQAPRLSATRLPQRVPTQVLNAVDSVRTEVQRMAEPPNSEQQSPWENKLCSCWSPHPGLCTSSPVLLQLPSCLLRSHRVDTDRLPDRMIGCYACFCPCLVYGQVWHRLQAASPAEEHPSCNMGCFAFFCGGCLAMPLPIVLLARKLKHLRNRYNIRGSFEGDIMKALCCTVCALVQAEKEIKGKEKGQEGQYGQRREMMEM